MKVRLLSSHIFVLNCECVYLKNSIKIFNKNKNLLQSLKYYYYCNYLETASMNLSKAIAKKLQEPRMAF